MVVEDPGHIADAYDLAMKARRTLPDDPELAQVLAEISYKRKQFAYALHLLLGKREEKAIECDVSLLLGNVSLATEGKILEPGCPAESFGSRASGAFLTDAKGALAQLNRE